jgi:hypothetical protein
MLRWICRHHHHKLFMVMQDMQDSSPVGTDMYRNPKLKVHHGRALVALSGSKLHEQTGHMPVVPVRAEHPHSLLPDAIATSLRGLTTSTSETATSMKGRCRPKELSPNMLKTPHDTTRSNKQTTKSPWNCFESSMKKLRLSTGTMGITLHPVSKPA